MEELKIYNVYFFSNKTNKIFVFPGSGLEKLIKSLKGDKEVYKIFFYEEDFSDEDLGLYLLSESYTSTPLKPTDFYPSFYEGISKEELDLFFNDIVKYHYDFNSIVYNEDLTNKQEELLNKYYSEMGVFGEYELFYKGPDDILIFRIYLKDASTYLYCAVLFSSNY